MARPRAGFFVSYRLIVFAVTVTIGAFGFRAFAQAACTAPGTWRAPLNYFCPNAPAIANDVNANTAQLVTWIEAKVGQVGQPFVLANNSVSSSTIANGSVGTADLAPSAVDATVLADNVVTQNKVVNPVAVYTLHANCGGNTLSSSATCSYSSILCRPSCAPGVNGFEACNGTCPACFVQPTPAGCQASNVLRGYLVGP